MTTTFRLLLLCSILAGCANPAAPGIGCCAAPAPGTAKIYLGGQVSGAVTITR